MNDVTARQSVAAFVLATLVSIVLMATPARAAIEPGESGDGVADLLLDEVFGSLTLDTDGNTMNGYVIRSEAGVFTGAPANNLGWFVDDTDTQISGNMGFELTGIHPLGNVIGPEWEVIAEPFDPYQDMTFTCTFAGTPGTFLGNLIIVPEPATLGLLLLGGLALLRRRKGA